MQIAHSYYVRQREGHGLAIVQSCDRKFYNCLIFSPVSKKDMDMDVFHVLIVSINKFYMIFNPEIYD